MTAPDDRRAHDDAQTVDATMARDDAQAVGAATARDDAQARDATRAARRRLLETMPKAELHLHLDGSLRIATAIELARTRGIEAPDDWFGMSAALVGEMPGTSQAELLKRFGLPAALTPAARALQRLTVGLVESKAANNYRYGQVP